MAGWSPPKTDIEKEIGSGGRGKGDRKRFGAAEPAQSKKGENSGRCGSGGRNKSGGKGGGVRGKRGRDRGRRVFQGDLVQKAWGKGKGGKGRRNEPTAETAEFTTEKQNR